SFRGHEDGPPSARIIMPQASRRSHIPLSRITVPGHSQLEGLVSAAQVIQVIRGFGNYIWSLWAIYFGPTPCADCAHQLPPRGYGYEDLQKIGSAPKIKLPGLDFFAPCLKV